MKKVTHNKKEYTIIKSNEYPCDKCIIECYVGMICPIPQGYIVSEKIQTLPDDMEKTIWEICNCYHVACKWSPILKYNLNVIRDSVHYLINDGCYNVAIYNFNVFKTTEFYKELKKRNLV